MSLFSSFKSFKSFRSPLFTPFKSNALLPPTLYPTFKRYYMPSIFESTANGERQIDLFTKLLKERIILLTSEVNETTAAYILPQLLFLDSDDPIKPIQLYINSPGGEVCSGLAIYDCIQAIQAPVETFCMGQASSMASLLLASGAPGRRCASPHSRIMVHQPRGGMTGVAADLDIAAREILRTMGILNGIYQKHTGKDLSYIESKMQRDCFMSPEEAIQFGLIDSIMACKKTEQPPQLARASA